MDIFDELLGYQLRRLSVVMMADLSETLAPLDLKPAEASVLFIVAAYGGVTQAEIGRSLGIQRANMAPLMANLARRGLVQREQVDGRSQALRLTATGETLYRQAWQATQAHEARMFGQLPAAARADLAARIKCFWQAAPVEAAGLATIRDSTAYTINYE